MNSLAKAALAILATTAATPALAAPGDPVPLGGGFALDPIVDGRLRYEHVDTPAADADAVTLRLRAGAELRHASGLALLAEAAGTLALDDHYNAFPFVLADRQRRPGYAVVADPMSVALNRLQAQYRSKAVTLTLGRQRINLDDQRFVGAVGWRQNEQTFDAARAEVTIGPVSLDGTYATRQHTVFGSDAGPRQTYDGRFGFLGAGAKLGPLRLKAFAYLLDFRPYAQLGALAVTNADTQTYGLRATGGFKLAPGLKLDLAGSFARQGDFADNPARYRQDYLAGEAVLAKGPLGLTAGYEKLGGDGAHAFQTPMATLHKFNGWADLFLATPAAGLQDWYGGASYRLAKARALPGLNAAVTYHRFASDARGLRYGHEWDASAGFRLGRANLLAKYANYQARGFGVDTTKLWLQLEFAY